MQDLIRQSPVRFSSTPARQEKREHWNVVLEYHDENDRLAVVDLSHRLRLDLQDAGIQELQPFGIGVPETPGTSILESGFLVNRMNRTQCSIWHLDGDAPAMPDEPSYTDVTEATLFLAMFGKDVFSVCEKLSSLDFRAQGLVPPFLVQGPLAHVPCQIVMPAGPGTVPGILLTCSRGYGHDMVHAVLEAGAEFGMRPAGEERFTAWIRQC